VGELCLVFLLFQYRKKASARKARAPNATPTLIPAFAPVDNGMDVAVDEVLVLLDMAFEVELKAKGEDIELGRLELW
jgi:hypothetical protein